MSHKTYELLRQELDNVVSLVAINGLYVHNKSGGHYRVKGFVVLEATDEIAIRYAPVDSEEIEFVRPIISFIEVVEIEGKSVPRFEPADS